MSVELATLTGLKKDLRTFGSEIKEVTGLAGDALSKGDSFSIGTDGKFYKLASDADTKGSFSLDQETGTTLDAIAAWQQVQVTNSNGWTVGLIYRASTTTTITTANQVFLVICNPNDGTVSTQQIYSSTYQVGTTSFNPFYRAIKDANIFFIDDDHFVLFYDETKVNRSSNNTFNSGTGTLFGQTYSLNNSNGVASQLFSGSHIYVSGQTNSSNVNSSHGYSLIWPGNKYTYFYKSYVHGQQYDVRAIVNPTTFALTYATFANTDPAVNSRTSDHKTLGFFRNSTYDATTLVVLTNPSSSSNVYYNGSLTPTAGTASGEPAAVDLGGYSNYRIIDNLLVGGSGTYAGNANPKQSTDPTSMAVWETVWTTATNHTWTRFPIEVGNFPYPNGANFKSYATSSSLNFPWVKIGSSYYYIMIVSDSRNAYGYYNSVTGSSPQASLALCKLTKDVANSKYILDFVTDLEHAGISSTYQSVGLFKTATDELKVVSYNYVGETGTTGVDDVLEIVTYSASPFLPSVIQGEVVSGNIVADVALGALATGAVTGKIADINVPVGTALNGWVGIGNSQAIKE